MDGIPNTILEAFAVETPVVATRLSGIPEVVLGDQTGLLVEPGDVAGLAAALTRILRDSALGLRLGAAGRALVLERFDLRRNVEQLAGVLRGGLPMAARSLFASAWLLGCRTDSVVRYVLRSRQ